jgi:hypothetical protein
MSQRRRPDQARIRRVILQQLTVGPHSARNLFRAVELNVYGFDTPTLWNATLKALGNLRSEGAVALTGKAKGARYHAAAGGRQA